MTDALTTQGGLLVTYSGGGAGRLGQGGLLFTYLTAPPAYMTQGGMMFLYVQQETVPPNLIEPEPEAAVRETFAWLSDVMLSTNGTEQRVGLRPLSRHSMEISLQLETELDIARFYRRMLSKFKEKHLVPLYQRQRTVVMGTIGSPNTTLTVNELITDVRVGEQALIQDPLGYSIVTIVSISSGTIVVTSPENRVWYNPALVPLMECYVSPSMQITRSPNSAVATVRLTVYRCTPRDPFIRADQVQALTTLAGMAIVDRRPVGSSFGQTLVTGMETLDYDVGNVTMVDNWASVKIDMSREYSIKRLLQPSEWWWLMSLLDNAQGQRVPLLVPTFTPDFEVVSSTGGSASLVLSGHDYADSFWPVPAHRYLMLVSSAGTHYAEVTAASRSGADSLLTVSPALPAGTPWASLTLVSLMSKCRLSSDEIAIAHEGTRSTLSLSFRTTDT